jgi:ABC-type nitrate/sulfonate/bicarbonate transport system permease component
MSSATGTTDRSIANEIQAEVKERRPFSLKAFLKNRWFLYAVSLTFFFGVWKYVDYTRVLGNGIAAPEKVVVAIYRLMTDTIAGKSLWGHTWASLARILIGFSIAAGIAVPLGILMALNRYINAVVKPVFDLIKPMPPFAWISCAILWFGIDEPSKIFIIVIGTFVPCLLNSYMGIRLIEPELYDVIRMLGGNRKDEILQVGFPAAFPAIFAGLQISLSIAWTCVLSAELVSARSGLGFIIIQGMQLSQPALVLAGMVILAFWAWATTLLVTYLEKYLCPWKRETSLA